MGLSGAVQSKTVNTNPFTAVAHLVIVSYISQKKKKKKTQTSISLTGATEKTVRN